MANLSVKIFYLNNDEILGTYENTKIFDISNFMSDINYYLIIASTDNNNIQTKTRSFWQSS